MRGVGSAVAVVVPGLSLGPGSTSALAAGVRPAGLPPDKASLLMRSHPVSGSQQSATAPASAVSAPACDSKWNQVSSANQGVYGTRLFSVSAISPTAAWAVGDYVNVAGIRLSVVEYWDGSTWTVPAAQPAATCS